VRAIELAALRMDLGGDELQAAVEGAEVQRTLEHGKRRGLPFEGVNDPLLPL
jgi:hypothetical protein